MAQAGKLRKLRQRQAAGRPRLPGERYPSGDRKRSETEGDTMCVALDARMRHHEVAPFVFKGRDLAGFTLGRMRIDKKITEPELEAGIWYSEQMERYYRAVGIQSPNPRAQDLLAVRGYDGEVSVTAQERAQQASAMFTRLETTLGKVGNGVKSTVYNVCVLDIEGLRMMPAPQLRMLKDGLIALAFAKGVDV